MSAARVAVWLAWDSWAFRGEHAVANGWLQRARTLLDGRPDVAERAWLEMREGALALLDGWGSGPGACARGRRHSRRAGVVIGLACCYLIAACERVRDYDRAREWCARLKQFCAKWGLRPLFAVCRTQYASICMWRGTWLEAETELTAATEELASCRPGMTADGLVRLAELRRRQGRLVEAADMFDRAGTHGLAALGRAELATDGGDARAAAEQAERCLRHVPAHHRTDRAAGLDLLVRARVAAGDLDGAQLALAELEIARAESFIRSISAPAGPSDTGHALPSRSASAGENRGTDAAGLTKRELEVLRLVAEGLNNQDIAERLFVSEHTIHRHVANIFSKLSVSSRAAAVAQAARRGLL